MTGTMTKRERVEFLLDHWPDFFETLHSVDRVHGDVEGAVTMMPRMSRHPSVVELGAAINKARAVMPRRSAHMMAFYTAEWRNTTRTEKRKTKKGKTESVEVRVRERVLPTWIRRQKVEDAVVFVVASFRGEVFIPDELLEVVAA